MRWGIFWKKMSFDVHQVGGIVNAAFLLHNFLVDERERLGSHEEDAAFFRSFSLRDSDARSALCTETATPGATDNNEPISAGRPPVDVQSLYQQAHSLRERLCANLVSAGLGRRHTEDMKFNEYGQVYF